jgi:RimJ/RimL family protein N-acetyltransferase
MSQSVILTQLDGRKVKLRPFKEIDITSCYITWINDKRVTRFSNQRFRLHTEASSRAYLASFIGTSNLFISIRNAENDEAIGTMTAYINSQHGTADVGLLVGDPASWGKGYGQDAWNTLGNWLLGATRIRKLTAGTAAGNRAMIRIMERFDMKHEATRYGQELIEDMPHDLVYYARFRDS